MGTRHETAGATGFVGRRAEQDWLMQHWEETVRGGAARLVLVGGEPGVGKTALLTHAFAPLAGDDVTVLYGRADDPRAPYQLWVSALRPAGFVDAFRSIAQTTPDPATARTLLYEAALDTVVSAAPAVVLLDDLDHADESSLALIRHLVGNVAHAPVLFVAAFRDVAVPLPLSRLLADLATDARVTRRALVGMTTAEIAELTAADDPEALRERTGGNPLFAREVAAEPAGAPSALLADVVRDRVARLAPSAQRVLRVGALVGRTAAVAVIDAVVGESSLDALEEAVEAGLVQFVGEDMVEFRHSIVRDCVMGSVPPGRARELHAAIAAALATAGATAAAVGHRIDAGGPGAVAAAVESADRAREAFAYESAAAQRRGALDLAEEPAARFEIALAIAEDLALTGSVFGERDAVWEAVEIARAAGDWQRVAAAVARLPLIYGDHERVSTVVAETLAMLPAGDSAARARLQVRDFYERTNAELPEDARPVLADAVAMARRVDDAATLARAVIAQAIFFPDSVTAADLDFLSAHEGDMAAVFGTRTLRRSRAIGVTHRMSLGDAEGARRCIAAMTRGGLSDASRWTVTEWDATQALLAGRLDDAIRASDAAGLLGAALGEDLAVPNNLLMRAWVGIERDEVVSAPAPELFAGRIGERNFVLRAYVDAVSGDHSTARRVLDTVDVVAFAESTPWPLLTFTLALLVAELGDRARATALLACLEGHSGTVVMPPLFPAGCLGAADRILGMLADVAGQPDAARRLFARALELDTRIGADVWAAHDRFHLGRAVATDDPQRALALLDTARAEARRLGLRRLARLIDELGESAVFRPEGGGWLLSYGGRVARLPNRRGMALLAALLAHPDAEVPALDLSGGGSIDRQPVLDDRAKADYRRRIAELDAELDDAATSHDPGRAERTRVERDFIVDELARAVGLGGRDRTLNADSERARLNVTRAIHRALDEIALVHPECEAHLRATVHTGGFCSYVPDPRRRPQWQTQ